MGGEDGVWAADGAQVLIPKGVPGSRGALLFTPLSQPRDREGHSFIQPTFAEPLLRPRLSRTLTTQRE